MDFLFFVFLTFSIAIGVYLGTHPKKLLSLIGLLIGSIAGLILLAIILGVIGLIFWFIFSGGLSRLIESLPPWVLYIVVAGLIVFGIFSGIDGLLKDLKKYGGIKLTFKNYFIQTFPTYTKKPKLFLYIIFGLSFIFFVLPLLLGLTIAILDK